MKFICMYGNMIVIMMEYSTFLSIRIPVLIKNQLWFMHIYLNSIDWDLEANLEYDYLNQVCYAETFKALI